MSKMGQYVFEQQEKDDAENFVSTYQTYKPNYQQLQEKQKQKEGKSDYLFVDESALPF